MKVLIFADFTYISENKWKIIDYVKPDGIILGVINTRQTSPVKLSYSKSRIIEEAKELKHRGMEVHYMPWIHRSRTYIKEMGNLLHELCNEEIPKSILFNAEKHWHSGSTNIHTALEAIKLYVPHENIPWGVVGISPNIHRHIRSLLEICDYGMPEAYSIWKPTKDKHWSHKRTTEPGRLQRNAINHWTIKDPKHEDSTIPLMMGLNIYWGKRPKYSHSPIEEMDCYELCLKTTHELNIDTVAYWSLKHLVIKKERRDFLKNISSYTPTSKVPKPNLIEAIQNMLKCYKHDLGNYGPNGDGVDGVYGGLTRKALESFRSEHNLKISGGPTTDDLIYLINLPSVL